VRVQQQDHDSNASSDPSTLNPAPPDFFNAQCFKGGGGTICTLAFADEPFAGEPSGIVCDGTELLLSQERSVAASGSTTPTGTWSSGTSASG
jgi:hypothetical protein